MIRPMGLDSGRVEHPLARFVSRAVVIVPAALVAAILIAAAAAAAALVQSGRK
jgi:hypothetical protein